MDLETLKNLDVATLAVFATLAILSVCATTVSLYKLVQFTLLGLGKRKRAEEILSLWHAGKLDQAVAKAGDAKGILPRVLHATLSAIQTKSDDKDFAEEQGRQSALSEMSSMTRQMRVLEAVVQAAPMLGLLGTVIGMINAFGKLAQATGAVDPAILAGGIWTALTTTAIGLSIAIVFYFVAIWLEGRIDSERQSMEAVISAALHGRQ